MVTVTHSLLMAKWPQLLLLILTVAEPYTTVNFAKKIQHAEQMSSQDQSDVCACMCGHSRQESHILHKYIHHRNKYKQHCYTVDASYACPAREQHRDSITIQIFTYRITHWMLYNSPLKSMFIHRLALRTHQALLSLVIENHQFSITKLVLNSNL